MYHLPMGSRSNKEIGTITTGYGGVPRIQRSVRPGISGALTDAGEAVGKYLKTRAPGARQISGRQRQIDRAVDE